jgi:uncharacterized protein
MSKVTPEFVRQQVSRGRRYVIVFLVVGPDRTQDDATAERIQAAHLTYLFELKEAGHLVVNGPVLDHPTIKGMSIYDTADKEQARAWASQDPAVKAGRLLAEAYEWFGLPGDGLPE